MKEKNSIIKMKLKTLKDLVWYKDCNYDLSTMESFTWKLKQEAIKWVRDIRNSTPSTSQKKEDIRCFSESWIKHFFNITEEDLK